MTPTSFKPANKRAAMVVFPLWGHPMKLKSDIQPLYHDSLMKLPIHRHGHPYGDRYVGLRTTLGICNIYYISIVKEAPPWASLWASLEGQLQLELTQKLDS